MCGVAGVAGHGASDGEGRLTVERMLEKLAHRGPDHAALREGRPGGLAACLGYCRLSILDLSSAGNQPMANETDDIWLVYNGELYNHPDLRAELEAKGHRFRSRTDSETVVHAYEEWGEDAFARFNGMFALAIYDARRDAVLLARDRRGIKPLYYRWDGSTLTFASELKALVGIGRAPEVDATALWLYLCLGFVPSPYSMVAGIRKLEPGHVLTLRGGSVGISRYAPPDPAPLGSPSPRDLVALVMNAVERAVERQLMADVPVGVFLSGGLDSTIVATLAARHHPRMHTFAAGYADADGRPLDDPRYNDDFFAARRVAEQLGTQHHEVLIENRETLAAGIRQLVPQLDEPMVEPVFVTTHHLARIARDSGVPVVLTGDGADELFGGYDRYVAARRLEVYRRMPGLSLALPLISWAPVSSDLRYRAGEVRVLLGHRSTVEDYVRFTAIYHPDQALALIAPGRRREVDTDALAVLVQKALGPAAPLVDQMARADLRLWVGEHFNPRLDRMSMLHSVEARVPFQDDGVVELALSTPMAVKSDRRSRKRLLREAFGGIVPAAVRRRPKRSFQAPGLAWLEGGLGASLRLLSDRSAGPQDLFDMAELRRHAETLGRSTPGQTFAVSALIIAEAWASAYLQGRGQTTADPSDVRDMARSA